MPLTYRSKPTGGSAARLVLKQPCVTGRAVKAAIGSIFALEAHFVGAAKFGKKRMVF